MKQNTLLAFLLIVLTVYSLVNIYLVRRGLQALPTASGVKPLFLIIMLFLILTYPVGRICERFASRVLGETLIHIGSYYLAFMILAFFVVLLLDLVRLGDVLTGFLPSAWRAGSPQFRLYLFFMTTGLVLFLTLAGAINARHPQLRTLQLEIAKKSSRPHLRLALLSDIHLGTVVHAERMARLAKLVNEQKPDLILLAGDILDEDALSLSKKNICEALRHLRAPLGVFAIPGNHEYYGHLDSAVACLEKSNITVLRDTWTKVADAFYLIGREDRTLNQFGGRRKRLKELVEDLDPSLPWILMDHQPFNLEEAELNGIDLQLSGHTHHGQIVPFNWLTRMVYEVSWGYKLKGRTHVYVSSGAGTWGPPVRLGNTPEFLIIDLHFTGRFRP